MRSKKNPKTLLELAGEVALSGSDLRHYHLGAVGVRADGTLVTARNGPALQVSPSSHAEARLARKLDVGSVVFVNRVLRDGGSASAKPCPRCEAALRASGVSRVYFTTATGIDSLDFS